jgi:hypothetical protein
MLNESRACTVVAVVATIAIVATIVLITFIRRTPSC